MAQPNMTIGLDFNNPSTAAIYTQVAERDYKGRCEILPEDLPLMRAALEKVIGTISNTRGDDYEKFLNHALDIVKGPVPHVPALEDAFTKLRTWALDTLLDSIQGGSTQFSIETKLAVVLSQIASIMNALGANGGNSRQVALYDGRGGLVLESMWFDAESQKNYDERINSAQFTDGEKESIASTTRAMKHIVTDLLDNVVSAVEEATKDGKTDDFIEQFLGRKAS